MPSLPVGLASGVRNKLGLTQRRFGEIKLSTR